MPIEKILHQRNVSTSAGTFDVLVPLPADHDVCMEKIGLENFADSDEEWDRDFLEILEQLVGSPASIFCIFPESGQEDAVPWAGLPDMLDLLGANDHVNFELRSEGGTVTFTRGHAILWLRGDFAETIESLHRPVTKEDFERLGDLF
ncbi:MAG: hypothetical protein ACYTFG_09745 [Planctomycetota bacterium]|jgi:hypothetical protein